MATQSFEDINVVGSIKGGVGLISQTVVYSAPADQAFFIADRAYRVAAITGRVRVVGTDAGAVTFQVRKAPSGTAPASGTVLHTGTFDAKGTADTDQALTLTATLADRDIADGDALVLDVTGTTTAATGVISVLLMPR